jgi:hypothetical protein
VLNQEAGEALLTETAGAVWGGITADEGERAIGLSMAAKMAVAPGQKPSSRLRS